MGADELNAASAAAGGPEALVAAPKEVLQASWQFQLCTACLAGGLLARPRCGRSCCALCAAPQANKRLEKALDQLAKFPKYRSNDYAVEESDLRRSLILNTTETQHKEEAAVAWLQSVVIGILNGVAGFLFNSGIWLLNRLKFQTTARVLQSSCGGLGPAICTYLAFTCLYGTLAGVLGSYTPQAAGSGIPEIRCYLNGIHVKGLLTIRTFFAKAFGVLFSIAAGLIVGKEGARAARSPLPSLPAARRC
jgi:hypothetical protein